MTRITQVAITVPFDNATNELLSQNVQDAVEETGPYSLLSTYKDVVIPTKRQMSVYQSHEVENGFSLDILGELVIYE